MSTTPQDLASALERLREVEAQVKAQRQAVDDLRRLDKLTSESEELLASLERQADLARGSVERIAGKLPHNPF